MQIVGDGETVARFERAYARLKQAGQEYVDFVEQWCPLIKQVQEDWAEYGPMAARKGTKREGPHALSDFRYFPQADDTYTAEAWYHEAIHNKRSAEHLETEGHRSEHAVDVAMQPLVQALGGWWPIRYGEKLTE